MCIFEPQLKGMPNLHYIESTESTNQYLQHLCSNNPFENGEAVYTTIQTKGRGQRGNVWVSEAGQNLLFSMVFTPEKLPVKQQFQLTQWVAISVVTFFQSLHPNTQIKWPNDVYADSKKMGGILIENNITSGNIASSIIGIGLNINQTEFTEKAPNAVSLKQLTDREYALNTLANAFHKHLIEQLSVLEKNSADAVRQTYWKYLYRKQGMHKYQDKNGLFEAEIVGFSEFGHLRLKSIDGQERQYDLKEVVFL